MSLSLGSASCVCAAHALFSTWPVASAHYNLVFCFVLRYLKVTKASRILKTTTTEKNPNRSWLLLFFFSPSLSDEMHFPFFVPKAPDACGTKLVLAM